MTADLRGNAAGAEIAGVERLGQLLVVARGQAREEVERNVAADIGLDRLDRAGQAVVAGPGFSVQQTALPHTDLPMMLKKTYVLFLAQAPA